MVGAKYFLIQIILKPQSSNLSLAFWAHLVSAKDFMNLFMYFAYYCKAFPAPTFKQISQRFLGWFKVESKLL